MTWIPCSERMPDDDTEYLAFAVDRRGHTAMTITANHIAKSFEDGMAVTHWQPLPEPPK